MFPQKLAAAAAFVSAVSAQIKGFNYGATFADNSPKQQGDFQAEFTQAQGLVGAPGFNSARLYTMIQAGTTNAPTSAIGAATATGTRLLLGLWGSGGQDGFNNELAAFSSAIQQYGSAFTNLIDGISVGSEDLYRISPTGIENNSGVGAGPDIIAGFISQLRSTIANTPAAGKPVGHVDTWTAWVNSSNQATINACDFIGMDAYPYFQNTIQNGIDVSASVFFDAYNATVGAVGGKPVWITETGEPVSGATENLNTPSIQNAQTYWQQVACRVLGNINTWWYTLQDQDRGTVSPSFGLVGAAGGETPLYDLSCPAPGQAPPASSIAISSPPAPSGTAAAAIPGGPSQAAATGAGASGASDAGPSGNAPAASGPTSAPAAGGAVPGSDGYVTVSSTVTTTVTPTCSTCAASSGGSTPSSAPAPSGGSGGAAATYAGPSSAASPQPAGSGTPAPAPSPASGGKSCPASLSGTYQYPHLIVPVNSTTPAQAYGTSYNGKFSPTVSSIFNFDVPSSNAGMTCTLVFLLPNKADLQTSSFTLNSPGGLDVKGLSQPATQQTSYSNVPSQSSSCGQVANVQPGNSYVIASSACPAGQTVAYQASSLGGLDLEYFQDYNPSPIGMYLTVC